MKTIMVKSLLVILSILLLVGGGWVISRRWFEPETIEIIVVNKCSYAVAEFWEVVYVGMEEASDEIQIDLKYMNASFEHEIEKQKLVIDEAISHKPDVIVLIASDYYKIGPYAEKILENGIKLLLMDSDVYITSEAQVPFVGTNSLKAGKYLGNLAKGEVGAADEAIVLAHYVGVQTSDDREAGIKEGFGENRIIKTFSCDSDEDVAYAITKKALESNTHITVIFATNETVTVGAARAIEALGLVGQIRLYGFDGSKEHVQYLEKGIINYTIIQSPYQMGYLSVVNALKLAKGDEVPDFTETNFYLISTENMYDVGYREILFPFINKE